MRLLVVLLLTSLSVIASAQNRIGVEEIEMPTPSKGDQPAFEMFIPDSDAETVLSAWNRFHKSFGAKPKQDKERSNYYFTDNADIPELSENTIDIYTRMYETGGGVRFACAFDLGGVFISSRKTPDKFNQTRLMLHKFYAEIAMDAIVAEIEKELEALEDLKSEYESIDDEIRSYRQEADAYTAEAGALREKEAEAEAQIEQKNDLLAEVSGELSDKRSELERIDKASMVADLNKFSTDLTKVNLETNKIQKEVERKEAEIAELEADIRILKNDLVTKKVYREDLETRIAGIETRLEELQVEEKEADIQLLEHNVREVEDARSQWEDRRSKHRREAESVEAKLEKVKQALDISSETRSILEEKIAEQEAKVKALEDMKHSIE